MSGYDYTDYTRHLGDGMKALGMTCMAEDKAFMDAIAAAWDAPERVATTHWENEEWAEEREMEARPGAGRLDLWRDFYKPRFSCC